MKLSGRKVPQNRYILKHELIELRGLGRIEKYPYLLTRIGVYAQESDKVVVFLTNQRDFGATTLLAIYKGR